jgi:hypothetical protein
MADQEYVNTTGTELEILKRIERAWAKNNPTSQKRNTAKSLDWFRKYVGRSFNKVGTGTMFRDRDMWKTKMTLGKMYFFEYDAKHKDTLPLWDRYPLIFPFSTYKAKDGAIIVIGINLHYLPPALRMVAYRALLKMKTEKRFRKSTRLDMEWSALKEMSESKYFEHSVHAYRMDHVKSVFVEVPASAWELAAFLPTARFQKGTNAQAWKL